MGNGLSGCGAQASGVAGHALSGSAGTWDLSSQTRD